MHCNIEFYGMTMTPRIREDEADSLLVHVVHMELFRSEAAEAAYGLLG
jgi:hypothetical protein